MVTGQWRSDFLYDGLGRRRIAREFAWVSGAWSLTNETRFIYDGLVVVQECDSNNAPQVTYTRGPDFSGSLQGAGGIGGLLARTDASGSTFYHADGSGNVTGLIDSSGHMVARYLYDPFGRVIGKWGSLADANVMQFSSMPRQPSSGLSLYSFRAYDPALQRWLNRDPIGELGGINLYRFVGNNPISRFDPRGLKIVGFQTGDDGGLELMFRYPGRAGSRLNWQQFYYALPNRCPDAFDRRFERVMSQEATDLYPYGSLSSADIFEAIDRGYLGELDLPFGGLSHAWDDQQRGYSPTLTDGEAGVMAALTLAGAVFDGWAQLMLGVSTSI